MRTRVLLGLTLMVWGTGCVGWPADKNARIQPDDVSKPPVRAVPVQPEQVTPQNAHQISQALWDEMDRAELVAGPAPAGALSPSGKTARKSNLSAGMK